MELEMTTRPPHERHDLHDGGLVVALWPLALLIAEIELSLLAFAHMYGA
jgi:hypothetical protein